MPAASAAGKVYLLTLPVQLHSVQCPWLIAPQPPGPKPPLPPHLGQVLAPARSRASRSLSLSDLNKALTPLSTGQNMSIISVIGIIVNKIFLKL